MLFKFPPLAPDEESVIGRITEMRRQWEKQHGREWSPEAAEDLAPPPPGTRMH